ncbi:peptide-N4-(N-acetyl-beta-glucosaminyl) asparagineamidase A [Striga asiatica]|uniref:Peptide-N4-(N-acetyl-beta-glucosaminyl) asparagineamidase A n=1 Tax=Striga asiatica TaxID=4170 RepID=A0A5A7Q9I6_STRAF|nr:peptide-N4-(N-acetyl-beta-glucosaminyl) asparagineamidase A [Striga asiatica]
MGLAKFPLLFFLLLHPLLSTANLHKTAAFFRSQSISGPTPPPAPKTTTPTRYFEVTRPIPHPKTKPCSYLVLQHQFAFTYGKPLVNVPYTPASHCPPQNYAQVVLEWTATCKGRQFDRIFGVWLGGVEIFRSCTAEPRATSIVWTVNKDITRYGSLLTTNNRLVVDLRNVVDANYTGMYNAAITFHFYPSESGLQPKDHAAAPADFILPISKYTPKNGDDGPWFEIYNSTQVESKQFKIPQNSFRAVLEVCLSYHENDEFWYSNPPNSYISENNLTDEEAGNGPFREVSVSLDGKTLGAVWPFTVIYTGGINPLMWRPITGIGSLDLPSYDIELTPFLGWMLDGGRKTHKLGFSVTNALNVWYIGANLHLWLDEGSHQTSGGMLEYRVSPLSLRTCPNITSGLNGSFTTRATRGIVSRGWVNSSLGNMTTKSAQEFEYSNAMVIGDDGGSQTVNQTIIVKTSVKKGNVPSIDSHRKFTLYLYEESIDQGKGVGKEIDNVTLGIEEKGKESNLTNFQSADGYMIYNGSTLVSGLASTKQEYAYMSRDSCYARNVSSRNYTIVSDVESKACRKH